MFPSWFRTKPPNQKGKVLVPTWLVWETEEASCYMLRTRHFIRLVSCQATEGTQAHSSLNQRRTKNVSRVSLYVSQISSKYGF